MASFSVLHSHARDERRHTIDPRHEEPPHGDAPFLYVAPVSREDDNHFFHLILGIVAGFIIVTIVIGIVSLLIPIKAHARDDGRFANSTLKPWFDQLASKKGLCCSFADGVKVENVDWDTRTECFLTNPEQCETHYRVRLDGQWIVVPDAALITEPNKYGNTQVRCFIPGAGA